MDEKSKNVSEELYLVPETNEEMAEASTEENGKINNLRNGTVSPLIHMYFKYDSDKLIAKISDEYILNVEAYPYWKYEGTTITFTKTAME